MMLLRTWAFFVGMSVLLGPIAPSAQTEPGNPAVATQPALDSAPDVLAAWAQLMPKNRSCTKPPCATEIVLRAMVPYKDGLDCLGIASIGHPFNSSQLIDMEPRRNNQNQIRTLAGNKYPVAVCELPPDKYDAQNARTVSFKGGLTLDWQSYPFDAENGPDEMVILGDTGCRSVKKSQTGCPDYESDDITKGSWPFHSVAMSAAESLPQLVIHVGDYRYAEEDLGDIWEYYYYDFFVPARPLLELAPWVMARGNHDVCFDPQKNKKFKGEGWELFFGHVNDKDDCAEKTEKQRQADKKGQVDVYALDLSQTLRIVVLDSSYSAVLCESWGKGFNRQTTKDLLSAPIQEVWLITHYPLWDVESVLKEQCRRKEGPTQAPDTLRRHVQPLLVDTEHKVTKVFSGDLHQYQFLRPVNPPAGLSDITQYVAGNGGALLSPLFDQPELKCEMGRDFYIRNTFAKNGKASALVVEGRASCSHGFLGIKRANTGWRVNEIFSERTSAVADWLVLPVTSDFDQNEPIDAKWEKLPMLIGQLEEHIAEFKTSGFLIAAVLMASGIIVGLFVAWLVKT